MSKSKHSEAQILAVVKEVEAGTQHCGRGAGARRVKAHYLCLAGQVWRHGGQ